ncbi:MAG: DUF4349 domain-containing protein [Eubacteriales bacterium]|nr:DUF4349 domain-containing protein [Eubacteriales bacterium]
MKRDWQVKESPRSGRTENGGGRRSCAPAAPVKLVMMTAVLALALTGCASSSLLGWSAGSGAERSVSYSSAASDGIYYANSADTAQITSGESGVSSESTGRGASGAGAQEASGESAQRKLVRTIGLSAETEDLDALDEVISERVQELGGYIENSQRDNAVSLAEADSSYGRNSARQRGRTAWYGIRIPAERLDEFAQQMGEASNVTSRSESVRDITLQYVDTDSRREALEAEQERLLELMEEAATVSDVVAIEEQLTNVRYELQNLESQLRVYDNQVDYATVNLDVTEVRSYSPSGDLPLWVRVENGFWQSAQDLWLGLQEFGIWFLIHLPYILFGLAVLLLLLLCMKIVAAFVRRGRAKKDRPVEIRRLKGRGAGKGRKKKKGRAGAGGDEVLTGSGRPTPQAKSPWQQ